MTRWLGLVISGCVAACGGGGEDAGDGGGALDASPGADAAACVRTPGPADGVRRGVVSFPYTAASQPSNVYRVFTLDETGAIALTATTFEMRRSFMGAIAFTPDGELGLVAQDDGTLGVFRFTGAGDAVEVLHAGFAGDFYAEAVVMDPTGQVAYVVDANTRDNGGGIYRVGIGCDDAITDLGVWIPTRSAGGIVLAGTRAVVAAREAGATSTPGDDVHLFDLAGASPARTGGADAFGDDDAIVGGTALTGDGRFVLVGDNQGIFATPNRVAVAELTAAGVTARQVLVPIEDPLSIVMSPFDDAALVVSGLGDALVALDYAPQAAMPFSVRGPLAYTGARPELPAHAVMIERGSLRGLVLVPENLGIRRVRFAAGGAITDLGKTATGASGFENITGALGVQP